MAQWTFFGWHLINRKRHNECSAPLELARRTSRRCEDFLSVVGNIAFIHYCLLKNKELPENFKGLSVPFTWAHGRGRFVKNFRSSPVNEAFRLITVSARSISIRVRPRFRFWSENWNLSKNFVSLGSDKRHDFACFTSKRTQQKGTWNKRNKAKKSKWNENEPNNCSTKEKSEAKTNGNGKRKEAKK